MYGRLDQFRGKVQGAFKTNSHMSKYAKHILEKSHSFGLIEDTMKVLQHPQKGATIIE
jgi:hypothetical protein